MLSAAALPRVTLLPRRAKPFYGRHPWVYAGAVSETSGSPADGDEVAVFSHAGNFIARGLYNSQSRIRARLYTWQEDEPMDRAFLESTLLQAIHLRQNTLGYGGPGAACRLVFSEGDGLSGLIVDQYDRWLVVQFTALAIARRQETILDILEQILRPEGIYLRTERGIGQMEGLSLRDGLCRGSRPPDDMVIEESKLRFHINITEGQKTGFYLDQRENRPIVAKFAAGRRVLDCFCYTGAFGLHAARSGAIEVIGVDVSDTALGLARRNSDENGLPNMSFHSSDVFDFLNRAAEENQKYGMIILDPPKFARSHNAVNDALRGYRQLQTLALQLLEPNGIMAMCCCTGLIEMEQLESLTSQVAANVGRGVQILWQGGQSPDHPVSAFCLESSYLKCLVCRVL